MGFGRLIPLIIIIVLFLLGTQFMIYQLGSVEKSSNVTGDYRDQLNTSRDSSIVTLSILKLTAPVLGVVALVFAIGFILRSRR